MGRVGGISTEVAGGAVAEGGEESDEDGFGSGVSPVTPGSRWPRVWWLR